jgi:2,4-dienoyl-CoA reductase-like NADH-dependent reductase (Old Yellow Enzyme family)
MMSEYGGEGTFPLPAEMTREDIRILTDGFVQAAVYAQQAGFHGVEVHAANGYLLDQLLTPHLNLRTDEYGGTMANRFRIVEDIIRGIRAVTPAGFIIGLRLSEGKVNDLSYRWPEGALMAEEVLAQVKLAGPTYVHIAAEHGDWRRDCLYEDGSSYGGLARTIRWSSMGVCTGWIWRRKCCEMVMGIYWRWARLPWRILSGQSGWAFDLARIFFSILRPHET